MDAGLDHSLQERRKRPRRPDHINIESNAPERRINLEGLAFAIYYGYGSPSKKPAVTIVTSVTDSACCSVGVVYITIP